jgi:hypothetical protein
LYSANIVFIYVNRKEFHLHENLGNYNYLTRTKYVKLKNENIEYSKLQIRSKYGVNSNIVICVTISPQLTQIEYLQRKVILLTSLHSRLVKIAINDPPYSSNGEVFPIVHFSYDWCIAQELKCII